MRKLVALCLVMLLCVTAQAEAAALCTGDERVDTQLEAALGMAQARELTESGVTLAEELHCYAFTLPDGTPMSSYCYTFSGKIHFGRYSSVTRTALLNESTRELAGLEAVFADLDALQAWVDQYVEDNVQDELNSYLDASELLPVPLDAVCLDAVGMTIHYPAQRLSDFAGNAGAITLHYFELASLLPDGLYASEHAAQTTQAGCLPNLPMLRVGDSLHALLALYGDAGEPDYLLSGEIYRFAQDALRGVQVIAARGAQTDENALITGIRTTRFDPCALDGLEGGVSVTIDADTAESLRLRPGTARVYNIGAFTLTVYEENECAYALEICGI